MCYLIGLRLAFLSGLGVGSRIFLKLPDPSIFTFTMDGEKFPKVEGGGSLILAWQIRNKRVLVVGGGEVDMKVQLTRACH